MLARLAPIALPEVGIYKKKLKKKISSFVFLIGHALIGQDKMQVLKIK